MKYRKGIHGIRKRMRDRKECETNDERTNDRGRDRMVKFFLSYKYVNRYGNKRVTGSTVEVISGEMNL